MPNNSTLKEIQNQNAVERLHCTLMDRLKPAGGLKGEEKERALLEGRVVRYNYVKAPDDEGKHRTTAD
jgi:hypothetical protein